jgi:D-3-phosphoglycerate dehydrogenase
MKNVLVTEPMHHNGLNILHHHPEINLIKIDDIAPSTLREAMRNVDAVLVRTARLTADILDVAPNLQIVSKHGVGCDNIDVAYLSSRKIPVAIAAGANALSVAEHTLGLMLAVARDLPVLDQMVKNGRWSEGRNSYRSADLKGAKIVILGFGRVGQKVAPLCKAFGMDVVVADIALDADLAAVMGCRGVVDFRPELHDADFLSLHVPLDDSTRHIVAVDELALMKPGSILINCARGDVVDEDALFDALDSGHLRGAGIDVLAEEPPAADNRLMSRHDVVMTPHNGAGALSAAVGVSEMSAQNVLDAFDGKLRRECIFNLADLPK